MDITDLRYKFDRHYYYNEMVNKPNMETCLYCVKGIYTRVGDGKEVECPVCGGKGEVENGGSLKEQPRKCFLHKIIIDEEDIMYTFRNEDYMVLNILQAYDDIDKCIEGQSNAIMGY